MKKASVRIPAVNVSMAVSPRSVYRGLLILCVVALGFSGASPALAAKILFVGDTSHAQAGADTALVARLKNSHGAGNVTQIDDGAAVPGDLNTYNLVILSSTSTSTQLLSKYESFSGGVMTWEGAANVATAYGFASTGTPTVTPDANYTAAPTAAGVSQLGLSLTAGTDYLTRAGDPGSDRNLQKWNAANLGTGAVIFARYTDTVPLIAAYEQGSSLYGGAPAPGRRMTFFLPDEAFGADTSLNAGLPIYATAAGLELFDKSVVWAAAVPEPSTFALLGLGISGAGLLATRRRRAKVA